MLLFWKYFCNIVTSNKTLLLQISRDDFYLDFVEEMPGQKSHSTLYKEIGTSYYFRLSKRIDKKMYMQCSAKKCPARMTLMPGCKKRNGAHNHVAADADFENKLKFMDNCKKRAFNSSESFRDIFDSEMDK